MLNTHGEVADVLNVDQFIAGHSAYECVAYCAALARYSGAPDRGPSGSAADVTNLAQSWYARQEGSNDASNTNGMSLDAEYAMLSGIGVHYQALDATVQAVRDTLHRGFLVMICGAETGFYDLDLNDTIPYPWTPSGNHCILATGVSDDGNLLVHDCANIQAPNTLRVGPRRYDASRMQLVSATAVAAPWQGGFMLDPTTCTAYFSVLNTGQWSCHQTSKQIKGGILAYYRSVGTGPHYGLALYGLPTTNELGVPGHPGVVLQVFERGVLCYDPAHVVDKPVDAGDVYPMHLNTPQVIAQLIPEFGSLSSTVASLKTLQGTVTQQFTEAIAALTKYS